LWLKFAALTFSQHGWERELEGRGFGSFGGVHQGHFWVAGVSELLQEGVWEFGSQVEAFESPL